MNIEPRAHRVIWTSCKSTEILQSRSSRQPPSTTTRKICSRNTAGHQFRRQSLLGPLSVRTLQSRGMPQKVEGQHLCRPQPRIFQAVVESQHSRRRLSTQHLESEALWPRTFLTRSQEYYCPPRGWYLPEVFPRNLRPTRSRPHHNTPKQVRDPDGMIESWMCCWEKTKPCRELD